MSSISKTMGYYYPLSEIKSDQIAVNYFMQFFKKEFDNQIEEFNKDNYYDFTSWELIQETIDKYKCELHGWSPFCDKEGNWAWIKYIDNNEKYDNTNILLSNDDFIKQSQQLWNIIKHQHYKFYSILLITIQKQIKFFIIDWYNGSDFPLIINN